MEDFFKMFETPKWLKQSDVEVKFKSRMRKKMLFPIIEDNVLNVYKVSSMSKTRKLKDEYCNNLCSLCDLVTNDEKIKNDFYFRSSYSPYFRNRNLLSHRISTKEDLYRFYELSKIENRSSFLKLPQNEVFKNDDDMSFDEIVEAMSKYYLTFVFKVPSKLSKLISYFSGYLDMDDIASNIYYFLSSESRDFSTGSNPIEIEQMELNSVHFNNKEMSLSEDEKLSLIKDIFDSFKVECVYSSKIDEMNDFVTASVFGTKSKNLVLDFAQHNYDLLYSSEFSSVFKKIMSSKHLIKK